jgi:hypothetical protein
MSLKKFREEESQNTKHRSDAMNGISDKKKKSSASSALSSVVSPGKKQEEFPMDANS